MNAEKVISPIKFSEKQFLKWARDRVEETATCSTYPLGLGFSKYRRLYDHGFVADAAPAWSLGQLIGHEIAIISRTYCTLDDIHNPPKGLRCWELPAGVMGPNDYGIAIATVITEPSPAANDFLTACAYLPAHMLAAAISYDMTWDWDVSMTTDPFGRFSAKVCRRQ